MATFKLNSPHNRWGVITLIGIEEQTRTDGVPGKGFWTERQDTLLTLVCDCGKELAVWQSEFPGKRTMRDCGCGAGSADKRAILSCCVTEEVIEQVRKYAYDQRLTTSKACAELVVLGLGTIEQ